MDCEYEIALESITDLFNRKRKDELEQLADEINTMIALLEEEN